jgi:hypothetical protein
MELAKFTEEGLLPVGDYQLTLDQLAHSFLVTGTHVGSQTWDAEWRSYLIDNLSIMVHQLWDVGITEIFIDGSFVEDKDHPNDIDGYFVCDLQNLASGSLQQQLNLLDPHKVWTWDPASRRPYHGFSKLQLPMCHSYRVELYPHFGFGPKTGIFDRNGYELLFPSAFRTSRRDGKPRGIVQIIRDKRGLK